MKRNIYLATSWRNPYQEIVLRSLRTHGHEVYDFKNPAPDKKGFGWREIEGADVRFVPGFLTAIHTHRAQEAFAFDKRALDWADTCVMVQPCGRSAHLEAGYMAGQGKRVYFYLMDDGHFEAELMYLLGTRCVCTMQQLIDALDAD